MYEDEVPDAMLVASTSDNYTLEVALQTILGGAKGFTHSAPIHGKFKSGVILTTSYHKGLVQYSVPTSAWQVARTLFLYGRSARRDPFYLPHGEAGWLVSHGQLNCKPAAIVWAVWIVPK